MTELIASAIAQHRAGNLAEARKQYKSILARDPRSPAALHLLATLEAQEGNLKTALRLFNAALDINPRWADALADKGRVLTMLGRHEEALVCYQDATAVDRRHPAALQNQGCTLLILGRSAEALAVFDHMLRIEPNFAIALHNRAIALTDLQRYAEAVASCDKALAIQPDYAEALQSRGVALEYMYRHDLALTNFKRAVELNRSLEYLLGSLVASQLYCHDFQCLEQNRHELTTRVRRKERVATPWVFLLASDCPADQFACSKSSRPTNARRSRRSGRAKLIGMAKSDWRIFPPIFGLTQPRISWPASSSITTGLNSKRSRSRMGPTIEIIFAHA